MSGQPPGSPLSEEREATILLQVDDVVVSEVKGPNKTKLDEGPMSVLQIAATMEELQQLGATVATDLTQSTSEVIFVIIGEHKIPIIKNIPIIKKEAHRYTFVMPGLFLEVAMPRDVDEEEIEILETLFKQNGVLRIKGEAIKAGTVTVNESGDRSAARATVGDKISKTIQNASGKLTDKIQETTPKMQGGITKGSEFAREKLTPNDTPMEVKDSTKDGIRKTRLATKTAVIVSGQMASAMVALAKTLGTTLSGMVSEHPAGQRMNEQGTVTEVKKVAVAGVVATANVLETGTEALKTMLTSTCAGVSEVVEHKYGEDAGKTASEGMGIATDVVEAGLNLKKVGVRGLAKVAGKEAAKNILSDGTEQPQESQQPKP